MASALPVVRAESPPPHTGCDYESTKPKINYPPESQFRQGNALAQRNPGIMRIPARLRYSICSLTFPIVKLGYQQGLIASGGFRTEGESNDRRILYRTAYRDNRRNVELAGCCGRAGKQARTGRRFIRRPRGTALVAQSRHRDGHAPPGRGCAFAVPPARQARRPSATHANHR